VLEDVSDVETGPLVAPVLRWGRGRTVRALFPLRGIQAVEQKITEQTETPGDRCRINAAFRSVRWHRMLLINIFSQAEVLRWRAEWFHTPDVKIDGIASQTRGKGPEPRHDWSLGPARSILKLSPV